MAIRSAYTSELKATILYVMAFVQELMLITVELILMLTTRKFLERLKKEKKFHVHHRSRDYAVQLVKMRLTAVIAHTVHFLRKFIVFGGPLITHRVTDKR